MKRKIYILTFGALIIFAAAGFAADREEGVVKLLFFDPQTAEVSYELTQPAKVRIRVGAKDGPLLHTIIDWQERGAGAHKEKWEGLIGSHNLVFTFNYFTADDAFLENVSLQDIMPHPEQLVVGRFLPSLNVNRLHKNHSPQYCHEPELTVKLAKNVKIDKDGYAIIKGITPITIDIAKKDKSWFTSERYSIHIFTDDVFFAGELEGYSPYNFIFDPKQVNSGRHLIAVNYSGFADHIGIVVIPIYVDKG